MVEATLNFFKEPSQYRRVSAYTIINILYCTAHYSRIPAVQQYRFSFRMSWFLQSYIRRICYLLLFSRHVIAVKRGIVIEVHQIQLALLVTNYCVIFILLFVCDSEVRKMDEARYMMLQLMGSNCIIKQTLGKISFSVLKFLCVLDIYG